MSVLFRAEQLRHTHPDAFKALPIAYQEDDCLVFWKDDHDVLYGEADENQVFAIGADLYMFDPDTKDWFVCERMS